MSLLTHTQTHTHTHTHTQTHTHTHTQTHTNTHAPDFLGATGYASTVVDITPAAHEVTLQTVAFELKSFGM